MKTASMLLGFVALAIGAGCVDRAAILPQSPVILDSDKQDFGFVGRWQVELPTDVDRAAETEVWQVEQRDDGVYAVSLSSLKDLTITFHATSLDEGSRYAIVDVQATSNNAALRYLALAKRQDNKLHVWWVEAKNLAKLMHAQGHSAVLEYGVWGCNVYAEADELIDCVRKSSRDLVGKPTTLIKIED